jgi:calcineurin-like phosphoesterase family protein
MRFFTSDPHYGHERLRSLYCPERGKMWSDIRKHDKGLIELSNSKVGKDDDLWILGDFAFADLDRIKWILSELNGRKHLIVGNHDKYTWSEYVKAGFESVQRFAFINIKDVGPVGLAHDPSSCIVDPTVPWLVGHLHYQFIRFGNAINVGVDVRGFAPISEKELGEDFRRTRIHMEDDIYARKEILGIE